MNRCCCDGAIGIPVTYSGWRWSRMGRYAEPFEPYPIPDKIAARWIEGLSTLTAPRIDVRGLSGAPRSVFINLSPIYYESSIAVNVTTNGKRFTQFKFSHATSACYISGLTNDEFDMNDVIRIRFKGVLTPDYTPPVVTGTSYPATNAALQFTNAFVDVEGSKSQAEYTFDPLGHSLPITEIDFTEIANEVIESTGWTSGNNICFVAYDNGSDEFVNSPISNYPGLVIGSHTTLTIERYP